MTSSSKTQKRRQNKRTTQKRRPQRGGGEQMTIANKKKSTVVKFFLEMLNTVKLYHWKTKSFPQHKATDELYEHLNTHIDEFVEVMLGKDQSRVKIIERRIQLYDFSNVSGFKNKIYEYRDFLIDLTHHLDEKRDSDLLNIRDEILGDINKFLYLLSFDKLA
jgi:DNA-binding ferritin-like protein